MAPLGGELLESSITCSSRRSIEDKLEILMLGIHFDMSMLSWYSLLSSLKEQNVHLELQDSKENTIC